MQPLQIWIGRIDIRLPTNEPVALLSAIEETVAPLVAAANSDAAAPAPRKTGIEVLGDVEIDHDSGLMWTTEDLPGGRGSFDTLSKAAAACRAGGYDDWQLPDPKEALTRIDYAKHGPAIRAEGSQSWKSDYYWTRTECRWDKAYVWVVHFDDGFVLGYPRGLSYAFGRAVRRVSSSQ